MLKRSGGVMMVKESTTTVAAETECRGGGEAECGHGTRERINANGIHPRGVTLNQRREEALLRSGLS